MKYPVPPPKDGIWQKRKKRRRPYSSNDVCHPRVRDADQENNQNPQGGRDMQKVQTQKSSLIINLEGYAKGRLTITAVV